ncbi:MAG: fumarylacetoacetase [Micromonosporaceae bacterium]|nr:fumarylacetoacetase [Micromonosporaceae bacterium]
MTAPASWLDLPPDHPFGVATLPYGVFATGAGTPRVGVRVGEQVLDVAAVAEADGRVPELAAAFGAATLNPLLSLGRPAWRRARAWLTELLTQPDRRAVVAAHLVPLDRVRLSLPIDVADYVDFYASEYHASNVGRIFRPDSPPLTPNWKHLPIGYHGRAGTVVVSGTEIRRPRGQRRPPGAATPTFGPSQALDIEAELGFVVGQATELGTPVSVDEADEHLFGVVLLNDWSARDIQAWEYVPLGPFLGKSFATSISAWVVPLDALAAARVPVPGQDPEPLPYLRGTKPPQGLDIRCEVELNGTVISRPTYRDMYWSPEQMLAHMTVNGARLRDGDLFASGTISGPRDDSLGCLLELTRNGTQPLRLPDGSTRGYLTDGDRVTLRAWAPGPAGARVGLGEVTGTIVPPR